MNSSETSRECFRQVFLVGRPLRSLTLPMPNDNLHRSRHAEAHGYEGHELLKPQLSERFKITQSMRRATFQSIPGFGFQCTQSAANFAIWSFNEVLLNFQGLGVSMHPTCCTKSRMCQYSAAKFPGPGASMHSACCIFQQLEVLIQCCQMCKISMHSTCCTFQMLEVLVQC